MTEGAIPLDRLGAYVDGELGLDEAARIGRAAAADPQIARQIAILQSLRAGVAAVANEVPPPDVTAIRHEFHARPRRNRAFAGIAAAVLAAGIGLAGWQAMPARLETPRPSPTAEVAAMVAAYDAWRIGGRPPAASLVPPDGTAHLSTLIAATGLRLVGTTSVVVRPGLVVGQSDYLGPHGCRLSLFRVPGAPGLDAPGRLKMDIRGDLQVASWTAQDSFVLVARGMDQTRFSTIAGSLAAATGVSPPADSDLLASLSEAHQHCVG
jgi:hypothetical protein